MNGDGDSGVSYFPNPCPVCGATDEHEVAMAPLRALSPATLCPHPRERGHGTGCTCAGRSKPLFEYAPVTGRGDATTRVLTIGTFDLLHFGQVGFLRAAARLGTELVVGVNSDAFAASYKRRPVMIQDERIYAVRQLGYPALFNDSAGRALIGEVSPDVLAVGSDWARKDYLQQIDVTYDWLDARRITLAYVPYVQRTPISTSEIIRRIRERDDH